MARLIVFKETLAVLMRLMYRFLHITGTTFEQQQRHLAAKGEEREYRILTAYLGKDTERTIADLRALFFAPPKAIMNHDFTPRIRSIRIRLVGRALCHLHALIRVPRSKFPYKLFLALEGSHMDIQAVLGSQQCSHDALANLLLGKYVSCAFLF